MDDFVMGIMNLAVVVSHHMKTMASDNNLTWERCSKEINNSTLEISESWTKLKKKTNLNNPDHFKFCEDKTDSETTEETKAHLNIEETLSNLVK